MYSEANPIAFYIITFGQVKHVTSAKVKLLKFWGSGEVYMYIYPF